MKVECPKCKSNLEDPKGGGIFTKCPKCGLDGDIGLEMSYQKNEWEIENRVGPLIYSWKREDDIKSDEDNF